MAKAKSSKKDQKTEETSKIDQYSHFAKNVWLAGLGAYGKAFDEAKDIYDYANKETPKLFDELVKKGEKLEDETVERLSETQDKIKKSKLSDSITDATSSIEERIQKVRGALGFASESQDDLVRVEDKLDKLIKSVDGMKKTINGLKKSLSEKEVTAEAPVQAELSEA